MPSLIESPLTRLTPEQLDQLGRELDVDREITVTSGATEAIFDAIQAFIGPGDELISFEPFYDSYPANVVMAGGVPKFVPLRIDGNPYNVSNWKLDFNEVEKAISPKTKLIILNNPQNTPGRVFSLDELQTIANIAKKHNLLVLSDEVYEYLTYNGSKHVHIATLPGMWERTITVSSAGKTFSTTGWKIGWVIAPSNLLSPVQMAHQWVTFCVTTPMQEAVAIALERSTELNYFPDLKAMYQRKKDKLQKILEKHGLQPIVPQGSYFMLADVSRIKEDVYVDPKDSASKDFHFCRWLTKEIGVAAIPMSPFYSAANAHIAKKFVRFTFCKTDETLDEADKRLAGIHKFVV